MKEEQMEDERIINFGPFRLDISNQRLKRGVQDISLRPKPFAVLCHLAERSGRLVDKAELLKTVWSDLHVSETVLKVAVRAIRIALGDKATAPRFIETVPRRGYRFIAPIRTAPQPVVRPVSHVPRQNAELAPPVVYTLHSMPDFVGRQEELVQLHTLLGKAMSGERQVVFISGEEGIGKTTLVRAFLEQIAAKEDLHVAYGQCFEHYGVGEAYLPVLEALDQLCRVPVETEHLIRLLRQHAPTWLVQMPALLSPAERDKLRQELLGTSRERMLREAADVVETLAVKKGLVLVLEDLQWSDYSTLDLLAHLARRRQWGQLLVIGTYRPIGMLARQHPLRDIKQELRLHGYCQELALTLLSEQAVGIYLAARFAGRFFPAELTRIVYKRTQGNPLCMINVVNQLMELYSVMGGRHCGATLRRKESLTEPPADD